MLTDEQILAKTSQLLDILQEKCWDGYKQVGMKKKGGRNVPNCVPVEEKLLRELDETELEVIEDVLDDMKGDDLAFNKLFDGQMRKVIDFPTLDTSSELGKFGEFFKKQDYEMDWEKGMLSAVRDIRSSDDLLNDLINMNMGGRETPKTKKIQMKIGKFFAKVANLEKRRKVYHQKVYDNMEKIGYTGSHGKIDKPWKIKVKMLQATLDEKEMEDYRRLGDQRGLYIPNPGVAGAPGYDLEELALKYGEYWKKNAAYIKKEIDRLDNDKYSIIITRHPIDVMRMSDFDSISSCHSPPSRSGGMNDYYKCAVAEAMGHGAIAYVVETEHLFDAVYGPRGSRKERDLSRVEKKIQEGELFHDDARNRDSGYLTPVSRVRVRQFRYYDTDDPKRWDAGTELAVPEERVYGAAIPGLADRVRVWAREHQKETLRDMPSSSDDNEDVDLNKFYIFGGSYEDTAGAEGRAILLSRLSMIETSAMTGKIRQNKDTENDLDASLLSGLADRWVAEVDEITQEWNTRYANTHVDAEVQEDYDGGFYISVRASMQWKWDINEFSKLPNSYPTGMHAFDSINDIWGDVFDTGDGFINKDDNKNVRIGCTINLEHPEVYGEGTYVYDPDNLRDLCASIDTTMDDRRDAFKATIENFLRREGWMQGGDYINLAMEIEDGQLSSYEWDLETDGEYEDSHESYAAYSFDYSLEEFGMSEEVMMQILNSRDYKIQIRRNLLQQPQQEIGTDYFLSMRAFARTYEQGEVRVTVTFSITRDEPDEMVELFRDLVEGEMDDEDNLTVVFNKTLAQLKASMNSGVWPEPDSPATDGLNENLVKTWKQFLHS